MPIYYKPMERLGVIDKETMREFIDAAETPEQRCFISLAWLSGLRLIELTDLRAGNFTIDYENETIRMSVQARKHGGIARPCFSKEDPFVSDILNYFSSIGFKAEDESPERKLFSHGGRYYQRAFRKINEKIYGSEKTRWIVPHELRHSRLSYLAVHLKGTAWEIKSWSGHKTISALSRYVEQANPEKFMGKLG